MKWQLKSSSFTSQVNSSCACALDECLSTESLHFSAFQINHARMLPYTEYMVLCAVANTTMCISGLCLF